ncbi:hypothetical protein TNCV_4989751 [Trichonephila clavipes]|uniref:Uncharacterized protein n=1 Tax=Trichonephila clavipes TaxID=2585209 RepID=A0A8X6WBW3_TRICX|nr:hypothetical protein TNCV_4989751 [Trichonephila clavipes]
MMTMLRTKHMSEGMSRRKRRKFLEGESSSDDSDGNICNGKTILDHLLLSKSLEHITFIVSAVPNYQFQYKQGAISNKIALKIKMDLLKFKLEIAEARALAVSSPTNKSMLTADEYESVVIPPAKRSKYYNPPTKRPCQDERKDMYSHFRCVNDIPRPRKCRFENCESSLRNVGKNAMFIYACKNKNML